MTAQKGYSIIEVIVVVGVMAILAMIGIANFRSFREDQDLAKTANDLQTQLRVAQTNATTYLKCAGADTTIWKSEFSRAGSQYLLRTLCEYNIGAAIATRAATTYPLPSYITIDTICSNDSPCQQSSCQTNLPSGDWVMTSFTLLSGSVNFSSPTACFGSSANKITVNLKNTRNNKFKSLVIDQGGRVYEQ